MGLQEPQTMQQPSWPHFVQYCWASWDHKASDQLQLQLLLRYSQSCLILISCTQLLATAGSVELFIAIVVVFISTVWELVFVWFNVASSPISCCCRWWSRRPNHIYVQTTVCTVCVGARRCQGTPKYQDREHYEVRNRWPSCPLGHSR